MERFIAAVFGKGIELRYERLRWHIWFLMTTIKFGVLVDYVLAFIQ